MNSLSTKSADNKDQCGDDNIRMYTVSRKNFTTLRCSEIYFSKTENFKAIFHTHILHLNVLQTTFYLVGPNFGKVMIAHNTA